jgi:6-phosphogluconolactonase (cycloisomerase 2 family)
MAAYSIDTGTGALAPLAAPNLEGGECSNLRIDATGKYLYCAPGRGSGLSIYSIDPSTGDLSAVTELGYPIPTGQGATDVGITFNSKYAYATNRTDGTISLYTDDAATGYLTPMSPSTYPQVGIGVGEPYAIAIDPGDQLAYVVLEAEGLEIMTINADGTISDSSQVTINTPVAVAIYP